MSDELSQLGSHGGVALLGGGLATWLQRFFASKEQQRIAITLELLSQKLDALAKSVEKHSDLGERVALLEASAKAFHARLDSFEAKRRR